MTDTGLSKDAKRAMKMINKELKEQSLRVNWSLSDNVEELLNSLPPDQLKFIVSHYAVICRIMTEQIQKKPIPFELNELLQMVGLADSDEPDFNESDFTVDNPEGLKSRGLNRS